MAGSRWVPKKDFHPGGEKGKLHRELGIPTDQKIPADRLRAATHSDNPEIRRDAIRAETMKGWNHSGHKKSGGVRSLFRNKS
jgi:hypothetical protein